MRGCAYLSRKAAGRAGALTALGLLLGLLLLGQSCGGSGAGRDNLDEQSALPVRSVPQQLQGLPAPGELPQNRLAAYTLGDIRRLGSEYEAALPSSNATVNGDELVLASASGPALSDCAYAIYAFHLEGYDREPLIELDFSAPPADNAGLWLGVSNWAGGGWTWFPYDGSSMLNLGDLAAYTGAAPDYLCYLCVLCSGGEGATLSQVQFGSNLPPDSIFVLPEKGTADPAEEVEITVWTNGTLNPFYNLESVRLVIPQYNSYVPGSFNVGAPGGAVDAADGIWSAVDPDSLDYPRDSGLLPVDLGNGLIAYDFFVRPTGGAEVMNASGELFNFKLAVYTDVSFTFQRNDGSVDRTFYADDSAAVHFFTNDDNAGNPGISLSGNALPTADLQCSPAAGPVSTEFTLDAGASTDLLPGSIVQYEFDFGEGGGFEDYGAAGQAMHVYATPDAYTATVRVTDNEGGQAMASVTVYAGYFDEIENNDDLGPSQDPGALPVQFFTGSIGPQGVYDGDNADWYKVTAPVGKNLVCQLVLDQPFSNVQIELQTAGRAHKAWSSVDADGGQYLSYLVQAGDAQPLRVIVRSMTPDFPSSNYDLFVQSNPPSAALSVSPPLGPVPLDCTLDASASSDTGGSITKYEFDFGEGDGWVDNGAVATLMHSYETEGVFTARLRVTDNDGNIDTATALVAPGLDYDEVENNDTRQTANTIASLPVSGFSGSIGSKDGYIAYDGDNADFYSFAATTGDILQISCSFDAADNNLVLLLYNKDGTFLDQSLADAKSPQQIVHTVGSGESPLKLLVSLIGGGGDYSLDIKINPPVADISADVSEGPPTLNVNFNAGGSTDKAPGMIVKYEFDFGQGGGWEDYGTTSTAMASYSTDGTYAAKVRVTDNDGLQDTDQISIKVGDPYNEEENNDDISQANLVSFPLLNWAASLGDQQPVYIGYDGDDRDFIKFDATAGQVLSFDCEGDSDTADLDIHLEDGSGAILAESTSPEAVEHIDYTFTISGTYYIYLELWYQTTQDGFSDYICHGTLN